MQELLNMKQSGVVLGVVNRGLDILDNLTRLNITKYQAQFSEFLY